MEQVDVMGKVCRSGHILYDSFTSKSLVNRYTSNAKKHNRVEAGVEKRPRPLNDVACGAKTRRYL